MSYDNGDSEPLLYMEEYTYLVKEEKTPESKCTTRES